MNPFFKNRGVMRHANMNWRKLNCKPTFRKINVFSLISKQCDFLPTFRVRVQALNIAANMNPIAMSLQRKRRSGNIPYILMRRIHISKYI